MLNALRTWLLQQGFDPATAGRWTMAAEIVLVLCLAFVANFIAKRFLVRAIHRLTAHTKTKWDDLLASRRVFHRFSHLAPIVVIYHFAPTVLAGEDLWIAAVQQGCVIYLILATFAVLLGLLNAAGDILPEAGPTRNLPVTSFIQVIKLVLYLVTGIAVISLLIGKSPFLLLSGLGAMTAVIMLVFRDAILGFVAGIQLSANRMVTVGDWIEMPKYGADGDVVDVALTTVKVQNWDKTITTIPTYALISESFKNWRGMSDSGGRRIKRAINIDMTSVRFCDEAMLERFARIQHVAAHLERKQTELAAWNREQGVDTTSKANGRRLTNLGTFRAYLVAYLRHHPMIHQDMTFLVRQLAPTEHGMPIEVYVFSRDQQWANYESIMADIFDHIMAVVPEFDLRLFQSPSGADVRDAVASAHRG